MPHAAVAVLHQRLRGKWLGNIFKKKDTGIQILDGREKGSYVSHLKFWGITSLWAFTKGFGKVPMLELVKKKEEKENEAKGNSLRSVNFLICSNSAYW